MSEVIIIQLSVDQLKSIVDDAMNTVVKRTFAELNYKEPEIKDDTMIGTRDICKYLGIGRSRFESYKDELLAAGMFKLSANTSSFRMKREDFEKWLKGKQQC